jgi:hypothetical protein
MKPAAVLVGSALVLAAGVAVGWVARPSWGPVASDPSRVQRAEARAKELEAQVARLESAAREAASREAQRLAAAPAPATAPPRPADAVAPAPPAPSAAPVQGATSPRIVPEGYQDLVASVDWGLVGKNLHAMAPLLAQFGEEWAKTGNLPAGLMARLNEMNGPLVTAALQAAGKLKIPVMRANSAFTHPVFSANAIAAVLEAGGKPLSDLQHADLARLAEQLAREDATRLSAYDDRAWALQKSIDESLLRDRFYESAFGLLTDEQRALLTPAAARGRLQTDLFSAALVWAPRMQVLPYTTPEVLATAMERQVLRHFELKDDQAGVVREVVSRWAASLPPAWASEEPDALSQLGMVPVARILEAARLEIRMLDDLVRSAGFDEAGATRIRGTDFVLVPVRSGAK